MLIRIKFINVIIMIVSFNIKCAILSALRSRFILVNVYQRNVSVIALLLLCTKCAIIFLT